ncbi:hypothetical protein F4805DRAFT_472139 [Annulohypoxylon moriforme]|nr:hypothetical protein F4805DRAFT_472139 [Annulohypoxylon moriforme]
MVNDIDLEASQAPSNPANSQHESRSEDQGPSNRNGHCEPKTETQGLLERLGRIFKGKEEPLFPIKQRIVHETPYGNPQLGAFIDTTGQNHLIFRRFNYLQARVLLNLQDQLQSYEKELDVLDKQLDGYPDKHLGLRIGDDDPNRSTANVHWDQAKHEKSRIRRALLQNIEDRFERYITLMNHISQSALQGGPPKTYFQGLVTFYVNYCKLGEGEICEYLLYKDDLIWLKPTGDTSGIDNWLMKLLLDAPHEIIKKIFKASNHEKKDKYIITHSARKIMVARTILLSLPMIMLLVGPIYPLYYLSQGEMTEGTLVGIMFIQVAFTGVFAGCLKYLTRPKRHELFACTVAYLGVLLVFMSQTLQKSV